MTPVKAIDTAGVQDLGRRRRGLPKFGDELGEVPEKIPEFERPLDVEAQKRRRGLPEFELELGEVPPVIFPTREEAAEMFEPTAEDLIRRVYPEYTSLTVDSFNEWATTNPDAFVLDMVKNRGRTEDAEMLLRLMTEGAVHDDGTPYTQDEIDAAIDEIFDPEPARLEIPEGGYKFVSEFEGVRQSFIIDTDYNIKDKDGEIVARYDPETGAIVEPLTPALKVYPEKPVPVLPPVTYEEREERVAAFRDYRKRGGKLHYDLWEKSGMTTNVTFVPDAVIGQLDAQRKQDIADTRSVVRVFGEALSKLPVQLASSILQAIQGSGGASVVDQDWTNRFIKYAQDDLDKFISEVGKMQVGNDAPIKLTDVAALPQNISFSLTAMGAGLITGLPTALLPVPGARVAAYITGSAASGAVAYNMASYQIMQQYLEFKNEEQITETGIGLSAQEEQQLKEEFESKARAYGLWEAVPEAISNLAFFRILTAPLGRVAGQAIALKILTRLTALYGEEFITETITQKGQAGIEVKAGLREEEISWLQAFKEIAPQTFLLTTILGGTGAVTVATVNRIKKSLKAEIGPEHPSFQTIDEGMTEESITKVITPEVVKPLEPKPEVPVEKEITEISKIEGSKDRWEVTIDEETIGSIRIDDKIAKDTLTFIEIRKELLGKLSRSNLLNILTKLDDIARERGLKYLDVALFGRYAGLAEKSGFRRLSEIEKEPYIRGGFEESDVILRREIQEPVAPPVAEVVTPEQYITKRTEGMTLEEVEKLRSDLAIEKPKQITLERQYGEGFVDDVIIGLDQKIAELKLAPPVAEAKPPVKPEVTYTNLKPADVQRVKGLLNNLPASVKVGITEIRQQAVRGGRGSQQAGVIKLGKDFLDDTFYHEVAHHIYDDLAPTQFPELITEWSKRWKHPQEQFSNSFADYMMGRASPELKIELDRMFAKPALSIPEAGMPEAVKPPAKPPAEVKPAPEVEAVKEQAPRVTQEIETVISDLQAQIDKTSAEVKGKTGEAARISRETLKGLQREATYAQKTLDAFKEQINVPEATTLRSTIAAMSKFKGLPKGQLQDIIKGVAGKRRLSNLPSPHLLDILEKVREARPVRIKTEKVITLKTEKKIQSLKESLISSRQMTNEIYNHLMGRLNLNTDRYEHANKFITETEAKDLIMAMNDEVVLAEWDIKVQDALAKNPDIKEVRDRLNEKGMTGTKVEISGEPFNAKEPSRFWSMRYYMLELQKRLKAPLYDAWQKINQAHLVARDRHNQQITRLIETTPNFLEIAADDVALKRIEDYIASKHNLAKIKAPELSEDEMAIATELEKGYFEAENDVRFIRFTNAYAENEGDIDLITKEIPNAPKAALRRAIDIYEGKGADELRKFTDTQKWGVVGTGYDPRSFIKPILYFRAPKETTFAKGLLRTREGVEYQEEENNIIQRYSRHQKQLIALQEMSSLVRAFGRLYAEHAHKLTPNQQRQTSRDLSTNLNEMKGFHDEKNAIIHHINRLYAQVAAATFWSPDLVGRNKLQNFAFNTDYWAGRFADPRNKPISTERSRWFEVFVSQERVFQYDFLMYGEKPFKGFVRLTDWARRTSKYPWSDKTNRAEAFYVRINRVDRALAAYEKDGNVQKLIDDSGLNELEPRQQAEALELLAMDSVEYGIDGMNAVTGREAFALYATQQHVNNVHFLYDRAQRALAEMGETGKTLGNILVFSRSWGERFILQANKLSPESKVSVKEKLKALQIIVGVVVAGMIAGETYKVVTGKTNNPYNPMNILTWAPGGLAIGVTEDISATIYLMTQAVQGDESAFAQLPGAISGALTLALPFYKVAVRTLDAITDMKNVDVWVARKIREMVDEEYEVRGGTHEVERTLLEKLQRAIFGLKDKPETPQEKIEESESILGMDIEVADLPFTLEEPDIHDMRKLNSDLSRILKNVKPEEITKENKYSELAIAWLDKERYEAIWNTMPHKPLYQITELPEELAKWVNRNKRKLALVTQYQKLEGAEAKAFLDEHSELKENPSIEWLKQFPIANARLALWGQAKIYSMEAYDEFNKLIKELDIPDDAIPELTLPPKGSVESYFKYQDMLTDFAPNSWEVQYLMTQDDDLRLFLKRDPIETPMRSLELKTEAIYRETYNKLQDNDYLDTLDDKIEDDDGLTERDRYIAKLKATKINDEYTYRDTDKMIEAIEKGSNASPTSDEIINAHIEYFRLQDEEGVGPNTAEVMLHRFDDPAYEKFITDEALWGDKALDPIDEAEVPRWTLQVANRDGDVTYDAIDADEVNPVTGIRLRDEMLFLPENEEYRKNRRRIEAYELTGYPEDLIESYVDFYEESEIGYRRKRMLVDENYKITPFGQAMLDTGKVIDLPLPGEIALVGWDETYEAHKEDFDYFWGLSTFGKPSFISNADLRDQEKESMRYDAQGNPTDFYKAELRLQGYKEKSPEGVRIPEELMDDYVTVALLPEKGFEKERFLAEHNKDKDDYYKAVWLGILKNGRIDLREVPDKRYDEIYGQFKKEFDKWDAYGDAKSPLFEQALDKRADLREAMYLGKRGEPFRRAKIEQDGYKALIGYEEFVPNWVDFYTTEKPDDWPKGESFYGDDWYLQENPKFHQALKDADVWKTKRNFDLVPTREVWKLYSETYRYMDNPKDKINLRVKHRPLDDWLIATGKVSKTAIEQVDISKASKEDIIYAITRLSDVSDEEKARIEKLSLEEILDALDKTFQGKIQSFLNRGSLTSAEKEALKRMEEAGERGKERKTIEELLAELEEKLAKLRK